MIKSLYGKWLRGPLTSTEVVTFLISTKKMISDENQKDNMRSSREVVYKNVNNVIKDGIIKEELSKT